MKKRALRNISRREFLAASSAALVGLGMKSERKIAGGFVNESAQLGHMLRDHKSFPAPTKKEKYPIVIVGGGMAGLSAAWQLDRRGFKDFVLLELDTQAGGNSRWGENEVSRYPWAAHYLPVPDKNETLVRELMEELGGLKDGKWEERYLCFTPQERLFIHGRWQEGIEPAVGLDARDREQFQRLDDILQNFRVTGAFTIPLERGVEHASTQPAITALDHISVTDWLRQQKLDSPYLRWYMDYACRDDYGAPATATSAWAGVHYFASRAHEEKGPLTWPEGNGWIARQLIAKLDRYIRRNSMAHHIARDKTRWRVLAGDTEYAADAIIFAAPTFIAPYVFEGLAPSMTPDFQYSPWFTANLTLDRWPREHGGREPEPTSTWDNVDYNSKSLGYVVANHQSIRQHEDRSVWTYYWAMAEDTPRASRRKLLESGWNYFKELILQDLERVHPDIRDCVSRIDVMRMGHAMIRPTAGLIFDTPRRKLAEGKPLLGFDLVYFANSDLSGISIFENAQWNGVQAASNALRAVSR
jgi:hypothetical protein